VKRLSLTCLVGILTVLAVPSQETWAQSSVPGGIPGAIYNSGGGSGVPTATPGAIYNPGGGSGVPTATPGAIYNPGGSSNVPSATPGAHYNPPPPWKPPQGWVDWTNEDLPDILTVWLKALPDLIQVFSRGKR